MIDITKCIKQNGRYRKPDTQKVVISFRIKTDLSNWLADKNYSPRGIFIEACKELGYTPVNVTPTGDDQLANIDVTDLS